MKKYLVSYPSDSASWSFEFYALDMEDAKNRLEKIKTFGRLDGEIALKIPAFKLVFFQKIEAKLINIALYLKNRRPGLSGLEKN